MGKPCRTTETRNEVNEAVAGGTQSTGARRPLLLHGPSNPDVRVVRRSSNERQRPAMNGTTCRTCGSRPASDGCCGQCHLRRSCHCFRTAANASSAQGNQR